MLGESIDNKMHIAIEHHLAGRLGQAENGYKQVLSDQSDHFQAIQNLGVIAYQTGKYVIAMQWLHRALEIDPHNATAWNNLATTLRKLKKIEAATAACNQAIRLSPSYADAFTTLGNCLSDLDRFDEALAAYQQTVRLAPNLSTAHSNLAGSLSDNGRYEEAITAHRKAIELEPDNAGAHWNLALNLLLMRDREGWEEYEWRWKFSGFPSRARNLKQPIWKGEPLQGRAILLHAEQGLGDAIQFVRYVPWVAAAGGRIILECPEPLHRLFRTIPDVEQCIVAGASLPEFDVHCPLLSLPLMLGTGFEQIPPAPYLWADPILVEIWRTLIPAPQGRVRVGLVWAGSNTHAQDRRRSLELSQLASLRAVSNADFFTIQKGPAALNAIGSPDGLILTDLTDHLNDFADAAAMISQLELVITVDTAVAHLAGAMGKPVWVMLSAIPDWRWSLNCDVSPWYSSMRLFRQTRTNQWDEVVRRVAVALSEYPADLSMMWADR